jgi:phosphoglycerate kinase
VEDGVVTEDARLRVVVPTIAKLRAGRAKVVMISHFDRPNGRRVESMSLEPLVEPLSRVIGGPVSFAADCVGPAAEEAVAKMQPGDVLLLENLRFHAGEEANDPAFARELAKNGDLFVNDAFSVAHRAHASTEAITHLLPSFAGDAMRRELEALEAVLGAPKRPLLGVVGGSKVSSKLDLLRHLVAKLDKLAIGGGMANTFLFAQGWDVGASYCEKDLAGEARRVIELARDTGCELLLPVDVVVAERPAPGVPAWTRALGEIDDDERILDAGPSTVARLNAAMDQARTLVWNGPLGVFEVPPFGRGTFAAARHAASLAKAGRLIAIAGGGDTLAALSAAGAAAGFTYLSTAGGAFLEWLEGKTLPGVAALQAR